MAQNHGYPVQGPVAAKACELFGPFPGGFGQVLVRPYTYYHRRDIPNNGTTQQQFFNESKSLGVTNMQQPNALPANYVFGIATIRCSVLCGIDVGGSRSDVSSTAVETALSIGDATAGANGIGNVAKWHEILREYFGTGVLTLKAGEREILTVHGLNNFPEGGGIITHGVGAASLDGNASAVGTQTIVGNVSNGAPFVGNMFQFHTPFVLPGGQNFNVFIDWPNAVDFTAANIGPLEGETAGDPAGTVKVELMGTLITPGSN